jgi:phospholipid-translocating ATPase
MVVKKKALVVDDKILLYILDKRSNLQKPFLHLTRHCAAVLCCRATPLQKAFIVKIVKQQLHIRTLGIGNLKDIYVQYFSSIYDLFGVSS